MTERLKQIYAGLVDARNRDYRDDVERSEAMAEEIEEAMMMLLEALIDTRITEDRPGGSE